MAFFPKLDSLACLLNSSENWEEMSLLVVNTLNMEGNHPLNADVFTFTCQLKMPDVSKFGNSFSPILKDAVEGDCNKDFLNTYATWVFGKKDFFKKTEFFQNR